MLPSCAPLRRDSDNTVRGWRYIRYTNYYSAMEQPSTSANARDRLLLATAELLTEAGGGPVSTRAICDRAGVKAPTLYHHFGSKQGLVDAVLDYGFAQYVGGGGPGSADPIADLRTGWDRHVAFGLAHPSFYVLLHGQVKPGVPCGVTGPELVRLTELCEAAARAGLLRRPPRDAAERLFAANVGVTLSLIAQPERSRDPNLSADLRETVLAAITTGPGPAEGANAAGPSRATAAVALRAVLGEAPSGLSPGETALLGELLDRLARAGG